jgi:hypothetical protein
VGRAKSGRAEERKMDERCAWTRGEGRKDEERKLRRAEVRKCGRWEDGRGTRPLADGGALRSGEGRGRMDEGKPRDEGMKDDGRRRAKR